MQLAQRFRGARAGTQGASGTLLARMQVQLVSSHDIFNILQGMGEAWPQVCGGDDGSGGMGCGVFSSFWRS